MGGVLSDIFDAGFRAGGGGDKKRKKHRKNRPKPPATERVAEVREAPKLDRLPFPKKAIINRLKVVQRGKCAYCGGTLGLDIHLSHRVPRSKGGTDEIENLCLMHASCNTSIGTRTVVSRSKRDDPSPLVDLFDRMSR